MAKFIHLRNHTEYSLFSGAIKMKKLVALAKENGIPALTITDSHNMFGVLEFSEICTKAGIQPIIGCETVIDFNELLAKSTVCQTVSERESNFCKAVLIAKTDEGFLNLISLLSQSYLKRESGIKPHIKFEDMKAKSGGIIMLSGGFQGAIGQAILRNDKEASENITKILRDIFRDDFYIELQRHGWENEIATEQQFVDLAYKYNVPLVATNDCYFIRKDMFDAQDALSCIASGGYVGDKSRARLTPEHYFKSEDEMEELFYDIPEAIENTISIAKKVSTMAYKRKPTLPHFDLPEGVSEADELIRLSRKGLEERLKQKFINDNITDPEEQQRVREEYFKQLEFELGVIIQMDFPGYFLIVADFIVWSKTHGVPIGPGRGSGAGSVVAWSMKITNLDPIKFSLFFERFLNPERVSMPDFDVDFCQRGRARSIEYVQNKYGKDMVAQIVTFGKLQAKAVVKDVGRVLGMGYTEVDKISKVIPFDSTLEEALELDEDLRLKRQSDAEISRLFDVAILLEGLNRHSSIHAAGIVIGDKPLEQICPLYFDDEAEMPVVQYDKHYCEEVGLVKFDFLGLKTLTVIKDAIDFVKDIRGIDIDIDNIRLDDKKTFELLKNADSLAVFQIESSGMIGMLKQIKPDSIEDIIALISLYRPGPMDNIPTYIKRKHGVEPIEYMHPKMEPILKNTYGIIVYQEQVMDIAKALAGYTLGGADLLRRAMGKKIKEEMARQRGIFVEGCKNFSNIDEKLSNEIFDLLAKFAEYGFNKAHAAAYAVITYQTAYLKTYYPVEFMTSTLNMEIHDTDKINYYLQDIKKHKIKILPPDVNKSDALFKVELIDVNGEKNKTEEYYFNGKELALRYGLTAVKGVGLDIMEALMVERKENGGFKDIFDFCKRMGPSVVNKKTIESLAKSGSFDCIHNNRKQISDSCEILSLYAKTCEDEKNSSQFSLFDGFDGNDTMLPKLVNTDDWFGMDKFQREFEAFGFYLENHPLDVIKDSLIRKGITFFGDVENDIVDNSIIKMAGVIISTSIKSSDKGRYAYISLSDPTGLVELSLFNGDLITQHKDWLDDKEHRQIVCECIVRKDDSGTRISIRDFWLLDDFIKNTPDGAEKVRVIKRRTAGDFRNNNKNSGDNGGGKGVNDISVKVTEGAVDVTISEVEKHIILDNITIHISSRACLTDLQFILGNAKKNNVEKYTKVMIVVDENKIELPNEYVITDLVVDRIKNTYGVDSVDVQ